MNLTRARGNRADDTSVSLRSDSGSRDEEPAAIRASGMSVMIARPDASPESRVAATGRLPIHPRSIDAAEPLGVERVVSADRRAGDDFANGRRAAPPKTLTAKFGRR